MKGDNRKFVVGKDVRGQNLKEDLIQSAGNRLRIECLGEKHGVTWATITIHRKSPFVPIGTKYVRMIILDKQQKKPAWK